MNSKNSKEYWEKLLQREWLGLIENEMQTIEKKIDSILRESFSLHELSDKLRKVEKIEIIANYDLHEIIIKDEKWNEIWYIRPWHYSYNWVDSPNHLEKKIHDEYRWKWYWKVLFKAYELTFWKASNIEYSHEIWSIRLLFSFWYTKIYRMENGEAYELENHEIDELLGELHIAEDITYKLVRKK